MIEKSPSSTVAVISMLQINMLHDKSHFEAKLSGFCFLFTFDLQVQIIEVHILSWSYSILLFRPPLPKSLLTSVLTAHFGCFFQAFCDLEPIYTYEGTYDINTLVTGREVTGIGSFKPAALNQRSRL